MKESLINTRRFKLLAIATLVMSPLFAPEIVLADPAPQGQMTATMVGTTISLPATLPQAINPTDQYQYQMALADGNGGVLPDLFLDNPALNSIGLTSATYPDSNGQSVTGVVYAVYGSDLASIGNPTVTLNPQDAGTFNVTQSVYDVTIGQYVPLSSSPTSTITVTPQIPTLSFQADPDMVTTGGVGYYAANVPIPTDGGKAYYHVQILKDGAPITNSDVPSMWDSTTNRQGTPVPIQNGVATYGYPEGIALTKQSQWQPTGQMSLGVVFDTPGNYQITFTAYDAATQKSIGTAETSVNVGNPNVTATVYSPSDSPSNDNVSLSIIPPDGGSPISVNAGSISSGTSSQVDTYLAPSQRPYRITSIYNGSGQCIPLAEPISFMVDGIGNSSFRVSLPEAPQSGPFTVTVHASEYPSASMGPWDVVLVYPITSDGTIDSTSPTLIPMSSWTFTLPIGKFYIAGINVPMNGNPDWLTIGKEVDVTSDSSGTTLQPADISVSQLNDATTIPNQSNPSDLWFGNNVLSNSHPVRFEATVTDLHNNPVAGVSMAVQCYSGNTSAYLLNYEPNTQRYATNTNNPLDPSTLGQSMFYTTFPSQGSFLVTVSVVDQETGHALASATHVVVVKAPNLDITVNAADGRTPVPNDGVLLNGPGGIWGSNTSSTGHFQMNLNQHGDYTLSKVIWNGGNRQFTSLLGNPPLFHLAGGDDLSTASYTDPTVNLVGSAFINGSGTQPLAKGWIQFTPTSGGQPVWAYTDSSGRYGASLVPDVQYQVAYMGNNAYWHEFSYNAPTITVNTIAFASLNLTPPFANVDISVCDEWGASVPSGYVGFYLLASPNAVPSSQIDYRQVTWLPISNGHVTGTLAPGAYQAVSICTPSGYWPVNIVVNASSATTTLPASVSAIAPPQATVSGTVTGSDGEPVKYGAVIVAAVDSNGNTQGTSLALPTDGTGSFTDLGWGQDGTYQQLLTRGQNYEVLGVSQQSGWVPLNNITFQDKQGALWNINIPAVDLTGSIVLDGQTVQSGSVGFVSSSGNGPQPVYWASIQNGTYKAALPTGTYIAQFLTGANGTINLSAAGQTPVSVTAGQTPQTDAITISNNFTGTLTNANGPVANAFLELSPVPNPTTVDQRHVVMVSTNASGQFAASLTPGTWYVIGYTVGGNFSPLSFSVSVGQSPTGMSLNVTPNVSGTITWGGKLPTNVAKAWATVKNTQTGQILAVPLTALGTSTWNYSLALPNDGTNYQVVGVDWVNQAGLQQWKDLSGDGASVTVPVSGSVNPLSIDLSSENVGTIAGVTGSGYVIFQNNNQGNEHVSVAFSTSNGSATFQTTLDNSWKPIAVSTAGQTYSIAQQSFANHTWTISVAQQ